jgi:hypothetical protein
LVEADQFVENVQTFAFINDAMFGAWDLQIPRQGSTGVRMTGHVGEVLKHNGKRADAGSRQQHPGSRAPDGESRQP